MPLDLEITQPRHSVASMFETVDRSSSFSYKGSCSSYNFLISSTPIIIVVDRKFVFNFPLSHYSLDQSHQPYTHTNHKASDSNHV
jgi:hypothetical protein